MELVCMKAQRSPGGTRRGLDGKDRLRRRRARKSASSSGGPSMLKHAPSTERSSASTTLDINSAECMMAASLRICVAATNSEHVEERQRPISAMRTSSIVHVALKVAARKQYHEQRTSQRAAPANGTRLTIQRALRRGGVVCIADCQGTSVLS